MIFFYTSDLHGDTNFYRELISICRNRKVDYLILGGDLLPRKGHNNKSITEQKKFIYDFLGKTFKKIKQINNITIYAVFGNHDWVAVLEDFKDLEKDGLVDLLHNTYFKIKDNFFITGYPYVPPTRFSPKDFEKKDLNEHQVSNLTTFPVITESGQIKMIKEKQLFEKRTSIEEDLKEFIEYAENNPEKKIIYVIHSPPFGTMLDRLYNSQPAGSKAVKAFIERVQPFMTLHGHIHESPVVSNKYWEKIGPTISINPGQVGGFLSGVLFNIDDPEQTLYHIRYDK